MLKIAIMILLAAIGCSDSKGRGRVRAVASITTAAAVTRTPSYLRHHHAAWQRNATARMQLHWAATAGVQCFYYLEGAI